MGTRFEKLKEWLSHPLNLLVSFIASLASILSVFLYFHSVENRDLTFLIHPAKATVVKSGQASRLKVSLDGKEITNDITAVQIAFWNAGKRPIRKSEILEPIIISTGTDHPILEGTLRKASRQLTHIRLDEAQLARGEVGISWDILEKLDGGVLQLIYVGDASTPIQVTGTVEGQGNIRLRVSAQKIVTPDEQRANTSKIIKIQISLGVILLIGMITLMVLDKDYRRGFGLILWCLIIASVLIVSVAHVWQYQQISSPFNF